MTFKPIKYIATSMIYHKGAFIFYRKSVINNEVHLNIDVFHFISFGNYLKASDDFVLNENLKLRMIIATYKSMIDDVVEIIKKK